MLTRSELVEVAAARRKRDIHLAWSTAALLRADRLPPLDDLLHGKDARPLEGDDLRRRREEHEAAVRLTSTAEAN